MHTTPPAQEEGKAPSVLQCLRHLTPQRVIGLPEALIVAEHQAVTLLRLQDMTSPAVPTEVITELPRMTVRSVGDIPVSGSAYWDGRRWILTVNAEEPRVRQRFSLFHEFKHVIDHPTRQLLPAGQHEVVADFFAASVLMPRMWVKRAWFGGMQDLAELARHFEVSERAMSLRLSYLGLSPSTSSPCTGRRSYYRARTTHTAGAMA